MNQEKFETTYSGERSRRFWAAVNANATSDYEAWKKRYDMAVRLEKLERELLRKINHNLQPTER